MWLVGWLGGVPGVGWLMVLVSWGEQLCRVKAGTGVRPSVLLCCAQPFNPNPLTLTLTLTIERWPATTTITAVVGRLTSLAHPSAHLQVKQSQL